MTRKTRRQVLAALGATTAVGIAGCSSGDGDETTEPEDESGDGDDSDSGMTPTDEMGGMTDTDGMAGMTDTDDGMSDTEMASVRVAHMSPDAPNVDVYVDGETVLSDVTYTTVSDYLALPTGDHTVTITAAGDPDTVPFEGEVTLKAAGYTIAAVGELTSEDTEFRPLVLEDDNSDPGGNMARLRVVHASPDAPAVDVTAAGGDVVLFDGVPFGESGYATVEANDYTVEIRGDTESNDGDVVADYDVSLNGGTVYTAFARGYLSPDDAPADEEFSLQVVQDASY